MRTIETQATLTPDGTLTARVPADIPPGGHQVVIVIDAQQVQPTDLMPDGALTARAPEIPPREHQVVIVIDAQQVQPTKREPLRFSAYPVGLVSDDITFRREDLYDDVI